MVQPFPQLQRPRLTAADAPALLARTGGAQVSLSGLMRLRNKGWTPAELVEARLLAAGLLGLNVAGGDRMESAAEVLFAEALPEVDDEWDPFEDD